MTNRSSRLSAIAFALLLSAQVAFAQSEPRYQELPNFHKVNEHLYRGGQPRAGGVQRLKELGVKTIINLRGEDELTRAEQKEAQAAGLKYFNRPMPDLSRPSDEQIARVMAIIDAAENQPVFVHCKRGSDRTGTVIAIYRISHENWTAERAISEAKQHGLSWIEFGMKDYISDYYKQQVKSKQSQPAAIQK